MAITHVASAAGSTSNPTLTDQATLSASIQAGDIIVVPVHNRYADQGVNLEGVTDNDSGGNTWTQIGASANGRLTVWAKIATSATASKVVTATVDAEAAILMGYSAYRTDTGSFVIPDSITNLTFEENASGNETHAGFTPDNDDSWVFLVVGSMNDVAHSSQSTTDPGALTERFDKGSTAAQDHELSLASAEQAGTATATGNFTWSMTNAISDSAVFAIGVEAGGVTLHDMAGDLAGAGVLAGDLVRRRVLAGDLAGSGVLAGDLVARRLLAGDLAGAAVLAGSMLRTRLLAGNLSGSGLLAGNLTIPVVHDLTGEIIGTATLAGNLGVFTVRDMSGQVTGTASLEGSMLRVRSLSGEILGAATLEGSLIRRVFLSGGIVGRGRLRGKFQVKSPVPSSMDYRGVIRFRPRGRR